MTGLRRRCAIGAVAVLVGTVGVACDGSAVTDAAKSATTVAHARWTSAAPRHYRMTWFEKASVGTTRVDIEVRDGHAVEVHAQADDLKRMPVGDLTVDNVFADIERAQENADMVTATYDPALGYPTSVRIDVDKGAIDDEYEFGIASLRVL